MPNRRKYDNQAGVDEKGKYLYFTKECGHITKHPHSKLCRSCWRATRSNLRGGYPWISINGRRQQEHRVIAEKVLGRPLKENEVVHHIDMDKTNNSHDNLLICTREYHHLLHYRMQLAWAEKYKNAKCEREAAKIHGGSVSKEACRERN